MDADWSVELGAEDPVVEVPWASPDGSLRFVDLRAHSEHIDGLEEVQRYPELAEFLRTINRASSKLASVKCDVWESTKIEPAEEILGGSHKVESYCDVIALDGEARRSFTGHEKFVRRLSELLQNGPDIPARVEFVVRRADFRESVEVEQGFSITCFVIGYGQGRDSALRQWKIALDLVANALLQTASEDARRPH